MVLMPHLVAITGLPGSGKSTFAKKAYPKYVHHETDKLRYVNGVYVFDPKDNGRLHSLNLLAVRQDLKDGHNVVVSNTFSQHWELKPYLDIPFYDSLTIYYVDSGLSVEELSKRNVHDVPVEAIQRMADRWEFPVNYIRVNSI